MAEVQGAEGAQKPETSGMTEAVGLFDDPRAMERAVEELLTEGFEQYDVSVLGSERAIREHLSQRDTDTADLADDPQAPRGAYPNPEARTEGRGAIASMLGYAGAVTAAGVVIATGGAAIPAVATALLAGGGAAAAGFGLGKVLDSRFVDHFENQVRQGGIVVWVRVSDPAHEATATRILSDHGAHDVHVHTLPPQTYQ